MHIAQSTLSQQIQQLEEYYGVQLFYRNGRSISLTQAGLVLQEAAARTMVEQDRLESRLHEIANGKLLASYPLRIFFDMHMTKDPDIANNLIDVLHQLQADVREDISFNVTFITQDMDAPESDIQEVLSNTQIDFWILGGESIIQHSDIMLDVVYDDQFVLTISKYHPLYREDLTTEDLPALLNKSTLFLLQNRSRYVSNILKLFAPDVSPNIRFEEIADVISMYVSMGMGLSVMPGSTKNALPLSQLENIQLPGSHFYTLAGYDRKSSNPLLPLLLERFKKKCRNSDLR